MCQTFALNFYICKQTAPHVHYSSPARPWHFGQPGSSSELFHWHAWLQLSQLSYGLAPDMDVWGLPGSPQVFHLEVPAAFDALLQLFAWPLLGPPGTALDKRSFQVPLQDTFQAVFAPLPALVATTVPPQPSFSSPRAQGLHPFSAGLLQALVQGQEEAQVASGSKAGFACSAFFGSAGSAGYVLSFLTFLNLLTSSFATAGVFTLWFKSNATQTLGG